MYSIICISIMIIFFIASMISVMFAPHIHQFLKYRIFQFKHWLKYGSPKKDEEEIAIKKKVKAMNINELIRLLNKYNIEYDINDIKKPSIAIMLKYYKLILSEKSRIAENKRIDGLIKQDKKKVEDDFDAEAFRKESDERFKIYMQKKRRNSSKTK